MRHVTAWPKNYCIWDAWVRILGVAAIHFGYGCYRFYRHIYWKIYFAPHTGEGLLIVIQRNAYSISYPTRIPSPVQSPKRLGSGIKVSKYKVLNQRVFLSSIRDQETLASFHPELCVFLSLSIRLAPWLE